MKRIFTLIICGVVFFLPCIAYPKDLNKGFAILPPVVDFSLSPGSTKIFPLELWNKSETDKAAIKIYPASIRELEGMQGLEDEKWSCVSWIDVMPKQVTLLPGEHKAITAKITIPQGAPVSSKYATIIFEHLPEASYSSLKPKDDESVISYSIVWRLASIVRLTITGQGIKKELAITKLDVLSSELSTEKDKKEDLIFQLGMENKGNVHLEPEGEIVIRTEKGIRKGAVPVRGFRVYPSLNREIKLDYNTLLPVGEYTAEAVLNYGGTQPARIKEAFSISSNEDKKTGNEKFSFISKEKKITITPLSLEPKILTLKIPQAAFRTANFTITNRYDYPLEITSELNTGKDMNIKLIPEKLILPSGESRKIMLEIMSPQKEGSFKGKVYFTGKNEDRKGGIHHLKAELIFEIGEKSKEQEGNLPQIPQKFILK